MYINQITTWPITNSHLFHQRYQISYEASIVILIEYPKSNIPDYSISLTTFCVTHSEDLITELKDKCRLLWIALKFCIRNFALIQGIPRRQQSRREYFPFKSNKIFLHRMLSISFFHPLFLQRMFITEGDD